MFNKIHSKFVSAFLFALLFIAFLGFTVWAYTPSAPMPQAIAALTPDATVQVTTTSWVEFSPTQSSTQVGFIFYPGGRVDYQAYAPAAHAIAAQGFFVAIPSMPFNLAFFGSNRAEEVIAAHPEIHVWAVGGHSLGGVAASQFAASHTDEIQGLALWASYPADSITSVPIKVISISGSQDGLSTPAKIDASRAQLPADTTWVVIEGGNHAQFGWYGPQGGDGPASISREDQQAQLVDAMTSFLNSLIH